jgi:hypothetical protein
MAYCQAVKSFVSLLQMKFTSHICDLQSFFGTILRSPNCPLRWKSSGRIIRLLNHQASAWIESFDDDSILCSLMITIPVLPDFLPKQFVLDKPSLSILSTGGDLLGHKCSRADEKLYISEPFVYQEQFVLDLSEVFSHSLSARDRRLQDVITDLSCGHQPLKDYHIGARLVARLQFDDFPQAYPLVEIPFLL